jgi:tRNA pseudouridine-54 N-methylase
MELIVPFNNTTVTSWLSVLLVEETTDLSQVTDKLDHIMLYRVYHNSLQIMSIYIRDGLVNFRIFYSEKHEPVCLHIRDCYVTDMLWFITSLYSHIKKILNSQRKWWYALIAQVIVNPTTMQSQQRRPLIAKTNSLIMYVIIQHDKV